MNLEIKDGKIVLKEKDIVLKKCLSVREDIIRLRESMMKQDDIDNLRAMEDAMDHIIDMVVESYESVEKHINNLIKHL